MFKSQMCDDTDVMFKSQMCDDTDVMFKSQMCDDTDVMFKSQMCDDTDVMFKSQVCDETDVMFKSQSLIFLLSNTIYRNEQNPPTILLFTKHILPVSTSIVCKATHFIIHNWWVDSARMKSSFSKTDISICII